MNENSSNKTILEALPEDYTFNLSDFALFLSVMKNKTAYENTLSIILDEPDLRLKEVKVEQVVLNKSGKRAIRLDAWARDEQNRHINTEMQNDAKQDNLRKRSRFYQGLLDTPVLKSGKKTKYKHLPSTIIIFITRDDIFRCDSAMYTFTEQCEEVPGLHLDDGTKKIFLNMTSRNGRPELISLLQYMKNTTLDNPEIIVNDKRIQSLDRIVNEVKQSEEWEAVKMNILEIGIEKGIEQGKAASILELLEETGKVSEQLRQKILDQHDSEILSKWLKLAAKAETIEEFERRIASDKV
ncbi:Rpn family recombination-promoting nuclease/putative transposase [Eisenbergiella tayi]|uniref:Rpn family recombination-promoting nuclease/putative transposase n=1 Tax=Eisenbergiella tayi TaxID=1432052 RepID=UPI0028A2FD96|nr:Rpn family recombination-promoting nuclease/putative transposase [Eisenbergiella tayi]MDT4533001.1 Rpn family recombination-promoting nuclease/putative transposase [Eisenbergiella tayi]